MDIDLEDWPAINGWMDGALEGVAKLELRSANDYLDLSVMEEETGHSRTRPFMSKMTVRRYWSTVYTLSISVHSSW